MTFAAYLVIALVHLTPFGPAQTNVAIPFPTMEACQVYMDMAKDEVKSASSFQLMKGAISCAEASELESEPEAKEEKKDPKEKQV